MAWAKGNGGRRNLHSIIWVSLWPLREYVLDNWQSTQLWKTWPLLLLYWSCPQTRSSGFVESRTLPQLEEQGEPGVTMIACAAVATKARVVCSRSMITKYS